MALHPALLSILFTCSSQREWLSAKNTFHSQILTMRQKKPYKKGEYQLTHSAHLPAHVVEVAISEEFHLLLEYNEMQFNDLNPSPVTYSTDLSCQDFAKGFFTVFFYTPTEEQRRSSSKGEELQNKFPFHTEERRQKVEAIVQQEFPQTSG